MFAKEYRFSIPEKYYGIGRKMLRQGFLCSFRDCSLPSPNDGWPNRQLGDYLEDYTLGNALYNGEFFPMINNISTKVNPTGTVHCVESGFSLLKNEYWEVFIKYKDNNVSHAHPDKLNVEVKTCNCFLTHDLSTSGYGSDISRDFYKKSCAHNTVVIDGKEQNLECDVVVTFCDENVIEIQTKNIYQNVNISRKVQLLSKTFIDEVLVDGCFQSVDSIFHCDAKLLTKLDFNKERRFEEYPYFKNVCGVACKEDSLILEWELDDKVIVSKIDLKNKELYIGTSPDNPNLKDRTTLIIRSFAGVKIAYKIEWYCR